MALRDVTNLSSNYIAQIQLEVKYAPLIRRGKSLQEQVPKSSFSKRREAGETNIDLWIDGLLYPVDPSTESPPPFRTTKQYLEFLYHGEMGMLGYTKRLKLLSDRKWLPKVQSLENDVVTLQLQVTEYKHSIQQLRIQCQQLQAESFNMTAAASSHEEDRIRLLRRIESLEATCGELRELSLRNTVTTDGEGARVGGKVEALEEELSTCKIQYQQLEKKMQSMTETPQGLRKRVHGSRMKSLDELAAGSGYFKRRRTLLRAQLAPTVVSRVQRQNNQTGSRKRLAGDSGAQTRTAASVASFLSLGEAATLIDQPRMSQATASVAKDVLKKIGETVGPNTMLAACDGTGVTHKGYAAIYKTLKNRIGLIAPAQSSAILPAPHRLASLRKEMNAKLPQFIGEYQWIEGRHSIPEVRVGSKVVTPAKEVILNIKNSLFVDLEVVQQSMVLFYGMSVAGNASSFSMLM
jgi:hypothetical protein